MTHSHLIAAVGLALLATACQKQTPAPKPVEAPPPPVAEAPPAPTATVVLNPTQGQTAGGIATFTASSDGVEVSIDLSGLTPGEHGIHIHEVGDCSAPDASSAGGHFNPAAAQHGAPGAPSHHAGDFGNITANSEGRAHLAFVSQSFQLDGEQSIVGRAFIVHEKPDDLTTQPTGNSGGRIACGVITN